MKFALVLLVLMPLAFAENEKRFLLDDFAKLLDFKELKATVQHLVDTAGTDATEHKCESECTSVVHATIIPQVCPTICKQLQKYAQHFKIVPKN